MGLDCSHGAWRGAYRAFARWRNTVAVAGGYMVSKHQYAGGWELDGVDIEWDAFAEKNYLGEWDRPPEDPLLVLIVHSDCEGVIHPREGKWLAERIERLIPLLPAEDAPGHIGNWRVKTQAFVDGLRDAAEHDEDLEFY